MYASANYHLRMGAMTKAGWQRMDVLVSEHGEDDVLHMVCSQVADGMSLSDISRAEGMPYSVLWRWLKGKDERMAAYGDALEARADAQAHEMLAISDGATAEDVGVAGLRIKARQWLSGKWGKARYGDEKEKGVGGVTVVVNRGGGTQVTAGGETLVIEGE